jgi:hypothetical protein
VQPLPFGKPSESGFIILKNDVLERRQLISEESSNGERRME